MTANPDPGVQAAEAFHRHCKVDHDDDGLSLPDGSLDDWQSLFGRATLQTLGHGDALLRRGDVDRALYFVLSGALEVIAAASRGGALGTMFREAPGSVIGEISFFDGRGRSATVWATEPTTRLRLDLPGFHGFCDERPLRGRELLFALGRVIAFRLRRGEARRDPWPY